MEGSTATVLEDPAYNLKTVQEETTSRNNESGYRFLLLRSCIDRKTYSSSQTYIRKAERTRTCRKRGQLFVPIIEYPNSRYSTQNLSWRCGLIRWKKMLRGLT